MRESLKYDDAAKASGAKIVHSCGYDSVPSDLACLHLAHHAKTQHGRPPNEVTLLQQRKGYRAGRGEEREGGKRVDAPARAVQHPKFDPSSVQSGAGGGTIDSLTGIFAESPETQRLINRAYCLDPPGSRYASGEGPDSPSPIKPTWSAAAKCWTAPFVMSMVNEPVVRRSNALLGYPYGE